MKKLFPKSLLVLFVVLVTSTQIFSQWVVQKSGTTQRIQNVRAMDDNVVWACGSAGVVLRTTNGGTTWQVKTVTNAAVSNYGLDAVDSLTAWVTGTVAGIADEYIWKTTNGGLSWVQQYRNPTGFGNALRFFDANNGVFVGDPDPYPSTNWEILTTTNGGTTWNRVPLANFPPADSVNAEFGTTASMDIVGKTIWFSGYSAVAGTPDRIYKSTNKGYNWTVSSFIPISGTSSSNYVAFRDENNGVNVALDGSFARTTDGGVSWMVDSTAHQANRFVTNVPGLNLYIRVGSSGLASYSTNDGATWSTMTTGTTQSLYVVDASTNYIWAAGNSGTILKYSGLPVGLSSELEVRIPEKFGLNQNYPNPFNPTTTIKYEVAKETNVSLKVYDVIGNEIATLVNETKPAGAYQVVFDASKLSNGVYLYKIQAGNFTATKKLILMK